MRFLNYLAYDFNCYRKEKIVLASVIFFTIIAQAVCAQIGGIIAGFLVGITFPLLVLFVVLGIYYMASHFGVAFRKKQTSILFLSFPVSVTEKFFARFINQIIAPVLIAILSASCAFGLLAIINKLYPLEIFSVFEVVNMRAVSDMPFYPFMERVAWIAFVSNMFSLCVMMLGSLVFGRYAIIKTIVSYTILSWIISPLIYNNKEIMKYTMELQGNPDPVLLNDFFSNMFTDAMFVYYGVMIVIVIAISYILFKRKTIIKLGF
ncbi:MAG: hypothetical protein Q4C30_04095 [Bacteroidia bacterium]|nr:hypothetical protein [Bacteroidia bacterium]